jgi:hypothetical protein
MAFLGTVGGNEKGADCSTPFEVLMRSLVELDTELLHELNRFQRIARENRSTSLEGSVFVVLVVAACMNNFAVGHSTFDESFVVKHDRIVYKSFAIQNFHGVGAPWLVLLRNSINEQRFAKMTKSNFR